MELFTHANIMRAALWSEYRMREYQLEDAFNVNHRRKLFHYGSLIFFIREKSQFIRFIKLHQDTYRSTMRGYTREFCLRESYDLYLIRMWIVIFIRIWHCSVCVCVCLCERFILEKAFGLSGAPAAPHSCLRAFLARNSIFTHGGQKCRLTATNVLLRFYWNLRAQIYQHETVE